MFHAKKNVGGKSPWNDSYTYIYLYIYILLGVLISLLIISFKNDFFYERILTHSIIHLKTFILD